MLLESGQWNTGERIGSKKLAASSISPTGENHSKLGNSATKLIYISIAMPFSLDAPLYSRDSLQLAGEGKKKCVQYNEFSGIAN